MEKYKFPIVDALLFCHSVAGCGGAAGAWGEMGQIQPSLLGQGKSTSAFAAQSWLVPLYLAFERPKAFKKVSEEGHVLLLKLRSTADE